MVLFLILIIVLTLIIIVALLSGMVLTSLYEVYNNVSMHRFVHLKSIDDLMISPALKSLPIIVEAYLESAIQNVTLTRFNI